VPILADQNHAKLVRSDTEAVTQRVFVAGGDPVSGDWRRAATRKYVESDKIAFGHTSFFVSEKGRLTLEASIVHARRKNQQKAFAVMVSCQHVATLARRDCGRMGSHAYH
jgi:hypothetical protein